MKRPPYQKRYQRGFAPWLLICSLTLGAACGPKTTEASPPQFVQLPAVPSTFELARDPLDLRTGEYLDEAGKVPARIDNPSTPSYALLPHKALWREITRSANVAFIAVKLPKQKRGFFKGKRLLGTGEVARIKRNLLATVPGLEAVPDGDGKLPRTASGMEFPGFYASLESADTLARLRARPEVDYVEPRDLAIIPHDNIACGFEPYSPATRAELLDETGTVGDIVAYTFRHLGITEAWNRFAFPGQGVRIALLDTGISSQQDQLQSQFTVGSSRPPAVHLDTTGTGLEDDCGHGTKVAGIVAAPKDGRSIAGVVSGATLTTVKVAGSPQHTISDSGGYEVCAGIAQAVAARAHIAIMAFGYPFYSPTIAECITDAFDSTSMIFISASGTKASWVVFPATMNREVIAVSAVSVFGTSAYRQYKIPLSVAYGPDVDFVSVMGDNRVPTTGRVGNATTQEIAAGGGTSAAAPHLAGIFALAIQSTAGAMPPLTRAQIIDRVRAASSIANVRDDTGAPLQPGNIGSGIPNAYAAAGGTTRFDAVGPATVQVNTPFTYTGQSNGDSALSYTWTGDGGTFNTPSVTFTARTAGTFAFTVTAVDPVDRKTFTVQKTVAVTAGPVPPPTIRELTSVDYVQAGSTFFTGGRGTFSVNPGVSMPAGCVVLDRRGHLQCVDGGVVHGCSHANVKAEVSADYTGHGFAVSAPAGARPEDIEAHVRVWYDGVHGVAVRVHYTVSQPAGVVCDVPGHTRATEECFEDNQCASLHCTGVTATAAGTCAPHLALGDNCTAHTECTSGYCDAGDGSSKTNRCMPNRDGAGGDICSHDNQCRTLACNGLVGDGAGGWTPGSCAPEKTDGQACTAHTECVSGFCNSTCMAQAALGGACASHLQCTSGYCDAGDGTSKTNRCMPNKNGGIGDICSHDNQCTTLNCSGLAQAPGGAWIPGLCADKRTLGTGCSAHAHCASGYCDAGDGTSKTNRCMPNKDGRGGDICSHDNQCASTSCLGLAKDLSGAWVPGACTAKKTLGIACAAHVECDSGYCDRGDGTSKTNRCMPNKLGAIGDICSHDNQCVFLNCSGLVMDTSGAWIPGTCAAKNALGAACTGNHQCTSGYCDIGDGTSKTARCMPNKNGGAGDICSHDNQCSSLTCAGLTAAPGGTWNPGTCASAKGLGVTCTAHVECGSEFCNGTCTAKTNLGGGCTSNAQCTSGSCDRGDGTSKTNRCMPNGYGQVGDVCSHDNQCGSLNCSGLSQDASGAWMPGTCASKSGLGAGCTGHHQCGSGYCDRGDGTSKTNRCMPNKNGRSGQICSHHHQCTSLSCVGLRAEGNQWVPGTCQ